MINFKTNDDNKGLNDFQILQTREIAREFANEITGIIKKDFVTKKDCKLKHVRLNLFLFFCAGGGSFLATIIGNNSHLLQLFENILR